ncbi:hypothetical protein [Paractinoplanes lichenicola]|uniref:Uncharacterized protein n=1 Tax=Paractinoplanes lichenicola TaxID=2802976 RepID=A0ABS1VMB5_9ACTN|nr:hypothetical protein [Actinoplanes lichenicola]MBL7255872.1 hypothetical protein [Actinoplanes lichenicola]
MTLARRLTLLPVPIAAAVLWALMFRPLTEPAGNNSYWVRELRWAALIALVLVLIVLAQGGRRTTYGALGVGVAWLAADIAIDRAGLSTIGLALGATAAGLACWAVVTTLPFVREPNVPLAVAIVAAVASGLATATESPTGTEPALALGSAATGSLLALTAVLAAGAGARAAALAVAAPWLLRYALPEPSGVRWLAVFAFTVLLIGLLAGRARAALAAVVIPLMLLPLVLLSALLPSGRLLTALAGHPPIGPGDEDVVLIVLAVPIGVVLARTMVAFSPSASPAGRAPIPR